MDQFTPGSTVNCGKSLQSSKNNTFEDGQSFRSWDRSVPSHGYESLKLKHVLRKKKPSIFSWKLRQSALSTLKFNRWKKYYRAHLVGIDFPAEQLCRRWKISNKAFLELSLESFRFNRKHPSHVLVTKLMNPLLHSINFFFRALISLLIVWAGGLSRKQQQPGGL